MKWNKNVFMLYGVLDLVKSLKQFVHHLVVQGLGFINESNVRNISMKMMAPGVRTGQHNHVMLETVHRVKS